MAKMSCAGGCGKIRDLEVAQKGAKDVSFTVSPKFWLCEDCRAKQAPTTVAEPQPRPLSQAVDPNVAFTFVPPPEQPARKAAAEQPKAQQEEKAPEAEDAEAEGPKA